MPGFLIGNVGILDSDGNRVDQPDANGDHSPFMLKIGTSMSAESSQNGSITEILLEATGGGGGGGAAVIALADHAAFRGLSTAPDDGTVIHFKSPPGTYVYSSGSGSGFPDDDNIVLKRTATLVGVNGRAFNAGSAILPTYAAYRLIGTLGLFTTYQVQARSSFGDGGDGIFDVDALDTSTADNDGTILVSGTKRAKRRLSGDLIDVRWFGANGDYEWNVNGQNATAANDQVPWRAFASVDGATYIGKKIRIAGAGAAGVEYSGTITAYNSSTHNWTVTPAPSTTVTNAGNLYATDNTAAWNAAGAFANLRTSTYHVLGYDLRSARLFVPRGTYGIVGPLTAMVGMLGDNATIKGMTPGVTNLFVVGDSLTGTFNVDGLVFANFHTVIKCWQATFNGLEAHVTFGLCTFQNIDYVAANTRNGNLFLHYDHCQWQGARAGKGFFATLTLTAPTGISFAATPVDNFTPGVEGTFTDGFILIGGTEDGILCPAAVGAAITIGAAGLSPHVDTGIGQVAGQAWIICRRLTNISIGGGSRFGGELGGLALVRLEEEASHADGSADGTSIAISGGTRCVSSNFAALQYADACPISREIGPACEIGNFGAVGASEQWSAAALEKTKRQTNWLQVALNRIGSIGNDNYIALPEPHAGSTFISSPALNVSRMYTPRERLGLPNQNFVTAGNIFDTSSATGNTASAGGTLPVLNLNTFKYYSNNGSHASGSLTKWMPDAVADGAGWYTAVLVYRTLGLGNSTCSFKAYSFSGAAGGSGDVRPQSVALEDTYGAIATASVAFWHDNSGTANKHPLIVTFDIPNGGASTNYIEFAEVSVVRGKWGGNYLPRHGVPMPNWMLQGAKNWDPGSVASGSQTTTTVAVGSGGNGAQLGDRVRASLAIDLQGMQLSGYVSAADTVTVVLKNDTGGAIDLASSVLIAETYR